MKKYLSLFGLVFGLMFYNGCVIHKNIVENPNQKWLKDVQRIVINNHNCVVSTTNSDKVKLFVQWAKNNGYNVKVKYIVKFNHDYQYNSSTDAYFIVVSK